MKVGIVTLFGSNYGNRLQNYALEFIVNKNNCYSETIIVDNNKHIHISYRFCEQIRKLRLEHVLKVLSTRANNVFFRKNERDGFIRSIRYRNSFDVSSLNNRRDYSFDDFNNNFISVSKSVLSSTKSNNNDWDSFDFFICGSDQIWNPTYSSTGAPYFLQFAPKNKRIAFAPSFGLSKLPDQLKPIYRKWLNGIPYLSVREEKGAQIIKELTGRDVPVLPDPTLCLSREEWTDVEKCPEHAPEGKYVLTYFLGNETNKYRRYIEKYAKENGLQIVDLFDLREPEYYTAGPAEFVWYIHHAAAMMTDSFHGTVFSLIFHVPFVVFDRIESGGTAMSSRIETLLGFVRLESRTFKSVPVSDVNNIDFEGVDDRIHEKRDIAFNFLKEALNSKTEPNISSDSPIYFLSKKSDCTGCGACLSVCPKSCIEMKSDSEGFKYPSIDQNRCIECKKCSKVCPVINEHISENEATAYIGYTKNAETRKNSSSGGIFSEIALAIIANGGVVYGAGFNDRFEVEHICVSNASELAGMRGSKYVQSDTKETFREVKQRLDNGETVLYSGTPCQIEGLISFLGKKYDNLYTQDIICHGVPSPAVWESYLKQISKGHSVKSVSFRNKKYGWHYYSIIINANDVKYIKRFDEDIYSKLFLSSVILRPSCYECRFKKEKRVSDFTLADCWNMQKMNASLKDNDKGISLVFANTDRARKLLEQIRDKLVLEGVDLGAATESQTAMTESVPFNPDREVFFANAAENGFEKAISDWYGWDAVGNLKRKLIFLKTKIRKILKR